MLVDTHVHLNDDRLFLHWKEVVRRAKENGVDSFFVVGYDWESSERAVFLSNHDGIYSIIGVHPHDSSNFELSMCDWRKLINSKTIGIGEIGLDYYKLYSPKESQKKVFSEFIQFAKEVKLPIIIHCREAWKDLLDIMRAEKAWEVGGIMHSYSGSYETARALSNWNFLFSFSGPITYPNAKNLRETLKLIPLDLIVIETDAPYLPPQPYRGRLNEPSYLPEIAKKICELKNVELERFSEILKNNLRRVFGDIL
ncbi:MAG: TatD family hydrolase [Dictyoglomus sp.]